VYAARRDHLVASLQDAGFKCFIPPGTYYVMTDVSAFGTASDTSFVRHLITHVGVAVVPGSNSFSDISGGTQYVRFCFCKKYETLVLARHQLLKLR
jgi:aspartate/methionine/tyrosine aminotransferase